jgi:hypothetical protein
MAVSANKLELIQIAQAVAQEKSIDKKIVLDAMADAIEKAAKLRYGLETDVRCHINEQTGEMSLSVPKAKTLTQPSALPLLSRFRQWNLAVLPRNPPSR